LRPTLRVSPARPGV